jgi:dTDP-glucose 4,6-dehydratase
VCSRTGLDDEELRAWLSAHEQTLSAFAGASLLITGATGWFGLWLLDILCMAEESFGLGLRIAAVSRDPDRCRLRHPRLAADPCLTFIKADVRDLAIADGGFSHIIHAAADTGAAETPAALTNLFDSIVDGTRRLLAAAGAECKAVLLLSSGAIYGPARPGISRFVESAAGGPDPAAARSTYAEAKRAAEQLGAIAARKGVPVRIARCFAFVGPHMPFDRHFAIGNFIADAVAGRPIRVKSDGRPQRSYLYMTDLVLALLTILGRGELGIAYNVGSEEGFSILELARSVDRWVGGRGVVLDGAPSDPADRYVPDTTRLRVGLGCEPEVPLEAAVFRTAAWYRANLCRPMTR